MARQPITITLGMKALEIVNELKENAGFSSTSATIEEIIFAFSQIAQNAKTNILKPEIIIETVMWRFRKKR